MKVTGSDAMNFARRLAIALAMLPSAGLAFAQANYPEQTVRILVGFSPGVAPDVTGRLLAEKLSEALGKPVGVENVTGAAGNIAATRGARAAAGGHTPRHG